MSQKGFFTPLLVLSFFLAVFASALLPKMASHPLNKWILKAKQDCQNQEDKNALSTCFGNIIKEATLEGGAKQGVAVLNALRDKKIIDETFDTHLLVHEVGRAIAEKQGLKPEAFLSCTSDFNYGCQHGFFEYALSQTSSYKEAATLICESISQRTSPKLYNYCYHGVGHGLMMALAYKLDKALKTCEELPNESATQSCWQGVLMENSNVAVTDEAKATGFSSTDPLAPCSTLETKYKWQCYINHAGYLMKVTGNNFKKAAEICLTPTNGGKKPCLQSLGLLTANHIWHKAVLGVDTSKDVSANAKAAWDMCLMMPSEAQIDCVIGAVSDMHNFDELKTTRSEKFCSLVDDKFKKTCFSEIGKNIASQQPSEESVKQICTALKLKEYSNQCIAGAALVLPSVFESPNLTEEDEQKLAKDNDFTKNAVGKYGASAVIEKLAEIMPQQNLSCHNRAHEVGRMTYEVFGTQAFRLCTSQCHSGCYHGATEAFFKENGTSNLVTSLSVICQDEQNKFFSHQCIHGVGHGLLAWSGYELYDSLDACDKLPTPEAQSSCATGVFMENIVGSLAESTGHATKYLSSDPQYPCTAVAEKYKGECYYLQTSRMVQLFNSDFAKIAKECSKVPQKYQNSCFQSMGRDASGSVRQDVDKAIANCINAPPGAPRVECFSGAAQDTFWDKSGQDKALRFCSLLETDQETRRCWETVTARAQEILTTSDHNSFCQKVDKNYQYLCSQKVQPTTSNKTIQPTAQVSKEVVAAAQTNQTIVITAKGYDPLKSIIKKGTRVIFRNQDSRLHWPASNIHPTHLIYPEFDPGKPVKQEESWEFTFNKVGKWYFHDHLYPNLTGSITVE